MSNKYIAAVTASYNRVEQTCMSLQSLIRQSVGDSIDIYVVDDASPDNTGKVVRERFPSVEVISGRGDLFWARGVRLGLRKALKKNYRYIILFNDDTIFLPDAVERLLSSIQRQELLNPKVVMSGAVVDPDDEQMTYGGSRRKPGLNPLKFSFVQSDTKKEKPVDVVNMNFCMVNRAVFTEIENIDFIFMHKGGDYDFSLRAKKHGAGIFLAPGYYGYCRRNPVEGTYLDRKISIYKRWLHLTGRKGEPFIQRLKYYRRHGGFFWPVNVWGPYVRFFLSVVKSAVRR